MPKFANLKSIICLFLIPLWFQIKAQNMATVFGRVVSADDGQGIEFVSVAVVGFPIASNSDEKGKFKLQVPAEKKNNIGIFSFGF